MDISALEKLIGGPRDSALLRMSIATALLGEDRAAEAEKHLAQAVLMDADYTAAWKQLGKVRLALEDFDGAREAWEAGTGSAQRNGDKQAEKEMAVFLRRLEKRG